MTGELEKIIDEKVKETILDSYMSIAKSNSDLLAEVKKSHGSRLWKWLRTDAGILIMAIGTLGSIFSYLGSIKTEIAVTQNQIKNLDEKVTSSNIVLEKHIEISEKDRVQLNTRVSIIESFMRSLGLKI